jgi:HlyD family secretion protein
VANSGIVVNLAAEENDEVSAGEALLQLDGTDRLQAAVSAAYLELVSAEVALNDVFDGAEVATNAAAQNLANARDAVRDAERALTNLTTLSDQWDIDSAYANMILAKDKLDKAREDYEKYENKPETNVTRAALLSILAQRENEYDDAVRIYNNRISGANDIDVAQAQADLDLAQALLDQANIEFEKVKDGPDPDLLATAQARLDNAQAQLTAAQTALDDLTLKAPFDGTVTQVFIRQNEWVNPGQAVMVIGDLSQLQIETTDLNEIDVARIHVGSPATVTFDALPDVSVEATVVRIASKSSPGTGVNYTVVLELNEIPEGLLWDMTAFVDIEVE